MQVHFRLRLPPVLASVLAAGLMLTVASCSHITPLGPDAMQQPHHLRSPLILQDVRTQSPMLGSGCPAGYVAISANTGMCYGGKIGAPLTITSAGVSQVVSFRPPAPTGPQAPPVEYGFWITVRAADVRTLTAFIPSTSGRPGPPTTSAVPAGAGQPAISVAGRTWVLVGFATRYTDRELEVFLPSKNQALQLQAILAASG